VIAEAAATAELIPSAAEVALTPESNQDNGAEGRSYADILLELEGSLAAVFRQYRRAVEADDRAAIALEKDAVACWVRRMITIHLEARIGMSSEDWVWLDADDVCHVELVGTEMKVSGRIWCSLPEGRREWTEPFAARIVHAIETPHLADYMLWWGTRATVLDLAAVERLVRGGEVPSPHAQIERLLRGAPVFSPPAPTSEDGWAYVFRMGENVDA
jgi:hypothetical protein